MLLYIYIYIYICRERDKERESECGPKILVYIYIYIYIHIFIFVILLLYQKLSRKLSRALPDAWRLASQCGARHHGKQRCHACRASQSGVSHKRLAGAYRKSVLYKSFAFPFRITFSYLYIHLYRVLFCCLNRF